MERFEYPVAIKRDAGGGYVVTCRDLPALITQGESVADARAQAADAMDEVFATYMLTNLEFPGPSRPRRAERLIGPPAETKAKAALYVAMKSAGVTKVQLARRLGIDEKEVRRMLDPHYGSKLPRIAEAVELLGGQLVIGLETSG
jgi:antitoxin HicB